MNKGLVILVIAALFVTRPSAALAHDAVPNGKDVPGLVRFEQRLDEQVPLGLTFRNENDQPVELGQYVGDKPVILALSYFECETLCPLVRQGLVKALQPLTFVAGDEFDVVLVSIDPDESAANAKRVQQETVEEYGRAGSAQGWHFLTGDHDAIDQLADAIGFRYVYDGEQDIYAHPSGVVALTPQGHISRYFFGIEYAPQDLRLGLVEASQNKIGTPIDQLMLLCFRYDPAVGKYSLVIMNVLRMAGLLTVALMALFILMLRRKESQRPELLG